MCRRVITMRAIFESQPAFGSSGSSYAPAPDSQTLLDLDSSASATAAFRSLEVLRDRVAPILMLARNSSLLEKRRCWFGSDYSSRVQPFNISVIIPEGIARAAGEDITSCNLNPAPYPARKNRLHHVGRDPIQQPLQLPSGVPQNRLSHTTSSSGTGTFCWLIRMICVTLRRIHLRQLDEL